MKTYHVKMTYLKDLDIFDVLNTAFPDSEYRVIGFGGDSVVLTASVVVEDETLPEPVLVEPITKIERIK